MLDLFIGWKEKLIGAGLAALLFIGWIFKIKHDAEKKGAQKVTDAINKETQKTKDAWQKIDNTPVGVDDALNSLRKRTNRDGR